jgi:quercetin dioxygenase-like cupin family protein
VIRAGDVIENPVTGEVMKFLVTSRETAGDLLRIEMVVRPGGFVAAEHVHPRQEERFHITGGRITLRVAGEERLYTAGEDVTIPPGTPHVWWNSGTDDLRVILDFRPAGRFAEFITTFFAMARAGQTDARGLPRDVLQMGVTLAEYRDVIRATTPPWTVQRAMFAVVGPLGRLLGYRPDVPYSGLRQPQRADSLPLSF